LIVRALPFAAFVLTGIVNTVLGPILPWLGARAHLTDAQAGALFFAEFAASVATGLLSGLIIRRGGYARTIAAGTIAMASGTVALAVPIPRLWPAALAICGVGLGLTVPAVNLLFADRGGPRGAAAVSAVNLAWGAGATLWPLLIAVTGAIGALLPAVSAALVVVGASIWQARRRFPDPAPPAESPPHARTRNTLIALFALLFFLYSGAEAAIGGWVTSYAARLPAALAVRLAVAPSAAFYGGLTAGRALLALWLVESRERAAIFGGLLAAIVSLSLALAFERANVLIVCAAGAGLGLSPLWPATVAAMTRALGSAARGALIAMGGLGAAIVPALIGLLSIRLGSLRSGLVALVAVLAILALGHAIRHRYTRMDQPRMNTDEH
jgi:MFS transporter, FHS family, glucose/mannose:H+ symporter